jgi:hypothetical protein
MCSSCWQLTRRLRVQQQQLLLHPAAVRAPKQPPQQPQQQQQQMRRARGVHLGLERSTSLTV